MKAQIDFSKWTDAQLEASLLWANAEVDSEIARRKSAGIWKTDGSHERVASLIASCRKPRKVRR